MSLWRSQALSAEESERKSAAISSRFLFFSMLLPVSFLILYKEKPFVVQCSRF